MPSRKIPVKIGARVLEPEQAKALLPSYGKIHVQIESFRDEARRFREVILEVQDGNAPVEYYNFDNTIAILGGRGSGKTSVMLTFRHEHSLQNEHKDIILRPIVPEDISESNDTLGWVLTYLGREVENLEKDKKAMALRRSSSTYDDPYGKCLRRDSSTLMDSYNQLLKSYVLRKNRYYEIIQGQGKSVGKAEYVKENELYVHTDQKFRDSLVFFVDQLVNEIRMYSPTNIEPLIIVFFDDVDISAERCPEVLETIRKYLCHPSVVTFVSGAYNVFAEAMTIEFMRRENIDGKLYNINFSPTDRSSLLARDKSDQDSSALTQRKIRSQDYLKKVLPPSFRFEMKTLENDDKAKFFYPIDGGKEDNERVTFETLLDGIYDGERKGKKPIPMYYFKILDDNPRGLINPFYFLYQKSRSYDAWDVSDVAQFRSVLTDSSLRLREYRRDIERAVRISANGTVVIDYKFISALYENSEDIRRPVPEDEINEDMVTLFLLLSFLELVCVRVSLEVDVINKDGVLLSTLNRPFTSKRRSLNLYPDLLDEAQLIAIYESVSKAISFNNLMELFAASKRSWYFEYRYYKALETVDPQSDIVHLLQTSFDQDPEWVKAHIDFLFEQGKNFMELVDSNRDYFYKSEIFTQDVNDKLIDTPYDGLGQSSSTAAEKALMHHISVISASAEDRSFVSSKWLDQALSKIDEEMIALENKSKEKMEWESVQRYTVLWDQFIAFRISGLSQRDSSSSKLLFQRVIDLFDDLIQTARDLSYVPVVPTPELSQWMKLRDRAPSQRIENIITEIIHGLENSLLTSENYNRLVKKLFEAVDIVGERVHRASSDFFNLLNSIENSRLLDSNHYVRAEDEVRRESLVQCLYSHADLYIHLKAWTQNQHIESNEPLLYFRAIKEKLRKIYGKRRTSRSAFDTYIISKFRN